MKKVIILVVCLFGFFIGGCVQKTPEKITNYEYPEVTIDIKYFEKFKNILILTMAEYNNFVVEANDYKIDVRRQFNSQEDVMQRAILQAADGSTIDHKGVDYYFFKLGDEVKIKGMPYLYKTFRNRTPEKYQINNVYRYNTVQDTLNVVAQKAIAQE